MNHQNTIDQRFFNITLIQLLVVVVTPILFWCLKGLKLNSEENVSKYSKEYDHQQQITNQVEEEEKKNPNHLIHTQRGKKRRRNEQIYGMAWQGVYVVYDPFSRKTPKGISVAAAGVADDELNYWWLQQLMWRGPMEELSRMFPISLSLQLMILLLHLMLNS